MSPQVCVCYWVPPRAAQMKTCFTGCVRALGFAARWIITLLCVCSAGFSCFQLFATVWTCSLPGSSVHGILQQRILERVPIHSSRGSSQIRDRTSSLLKSFLHCRRVLYCCVKRKAQLLLCRGLQFPANCGTLHTEDFPFEVMPNGYTSKNLITTWVTRSNKHSSGKIYPLHSFFSVITS